MKDITNAFQIMGIFSVGEGFIVEVLNNTLEDTYEAWIYHKDYGTKNLMFGMPVAQQRYKDFLECVECDIEEQKRIYSEDYIYED